MHIQQQHDFKEHLAALHTGLIEAEAQLIAADMKRLAAPNSPEDVYKRQALKDDRFAAMMEEATKYIGYPYVWGSSSPSTSFDCSGYISWVLNHSGWNVSRQTAQDVYKRQLFEWAG